MGKNISPKEGISNIEVGKGGNQIIISINPKVYPLEVIYSAAYVFLDRAYILIDGDPEEEIFVQMKPKDSKMDMEKMGLEFNNELVNYSVYVVQAVRNQPLRKAIIERALLTNIGEALEEKRYCDVCGCEMIFCDECEDYYCPTCEEKHIEEDRPKQTEEEKWEDVEEDLDFVEDPLNIAKPWKPPKEEENEKPKNKSKRRKG